MKKLTTTLLALSALIALTACNTVDGVGEDIENAGESMQKAAN